MEKSEQRKILQQWRDKFKSLKGKDATAKIYSQFYQDLEEAGLIDTNYTEHMKGKTLDDVMPKVENLLFGDCKTYLTFILRTERWSEGWFAERTENGDIYKLLVQACEVL
ncbi:MAG: hypothetical protein IJU48_02655 [Synergistaceae bacterium]|nr:hypothetical protein [Synergistaceae bacterium]